MLRRQNPFTVKVGIRRDTIQDLERSRCFLHVSERRLSTLLTSCRHQLMLKMLLH
jgi:hypothetical protein